MLLNSLTFAIWVPFTRHLLLCDMYDFTDRSRYRKIPVTIGKKYKFLMTVNECNERCNVLLALSKLIWESGLHCQRSNSSFVLTRRGIHCLPLSSKPFARPCRHGNVISGIGSQVVDVYR